MSDPLDVVHDAPARPRRASGRVVTFGEAMIRLAVPGQERLERASSLDVSVCGPELNTAVALAALGHQATWVSALPESPLGQAIARQARAHGADTSVVHWMPSVRAGLQFVEDGPDPRPSLTYYDAERTAMSHVIPGTFDWPVLLDGAVALHLSGVTLGLSSGVRSEAMTAVQEASRLGVLVSFDLTHRTESWGEADARQAFMEIIRYVDVLSASRGGLRTFFGIEGSYESILRQAVERLGVAAVAVNRKRAKGSRRMHIESMAMGKSGVLTTTENRDIEVIDQHGAGDAFVAGFLSGYLENPLGLSRAVSLGAATCALNLTTPGEFLCATRDEIEALVTTRD